jgi:DNA repair protein RecO (recombination protein O)
VAHFIQEPLKLGALQSACALCDTALPEREGHAGLFYGLQSLFDALSSDVWGPAYIMWEIAFLRELGFSLDLTKCAGGGDDDLIYVSPKTGRAVSRAAGQVYKERLLVLPLFLRPPHPSPLPGGEREGPAQREGEGEIGGPEDVLNGLKLTAHFLEHWVFAHHTKGIPEARLRFQLRFEARFAKTVE